MAIALAVFSVFIMLASGMGAIYPAELLAWVSEFLQAAGSIWWASGVRVVLAILLWFSASASRTPITFRVLAVLALAAAIAIPIVGSQRFMLLIDWYGSLPLWQVRLQTGFGVLFGAFLLWSVSRSWSNAQADSRN